MSESARYLVSDGVVENFKKSLAKVCLLSRKREVSLILVFLYMSFEFRDFELISSVVKYIKCKTRAFVNG